MVASRTLALTCVHLPARRHARVLPRSVTFDELVNALRNLDGLRDKGKVHPNFHFKSRPFLHFHSEPDGAYADIRFGGDFERVPASTAKERQELLRRVTAHVAESSTQRT